MQDLNYEITIPDLNCHLEQDEEYIIVDFGNRQEEIRLHDYGVIYNIPGLYEEIFYDCLKCNSPKVICDMLIDVLEESGYSIEGYKVLDFGAGNGAVGEQIKKRGCDLVIGVDILAEAKDAVDRDRAGIYDDYFVMDLSQLDDKKIEKLKKYDFDALITVAALGFNDVPPRAFLNAFNLVKDNGWITFNIKDRFLTEEDDTGYQDTFKCISKDALHIYQTKRYCHRLSLTGERLNYIGVVGQKIKDVDINKLCDM